jgi:hypothetical protein
VQVSREVTMRVIGGARILRMLSRTSRRIVAGFWFVSLILGTAHAAQLTVTWADNSDNESGFTVERKIGTAGAYGVLASVAASITTYVDATVTTGTTYCYRVQAYNTAGVSSYSNEGCAAAANPVLQSLTVAKTGTGTGTVASSPSGINCGTTCSASFNSGTSVGLSATAATGSTFTGWSGACTGIGGCAVVLDAAKSVTATFAAGAPTTYALTVAKAGTGSGTVTSSPSGISCGSTCSASYTSGTSVTLTATAATGSTFTGWSGTCSGTGSCTAAMSQARTVTATFAAAPTTGSLTLSSVTANQASPQAAGTPVTLTANTTGGVVPLQFKWWVWNGSTWTVARDWAAGNTLTWTPATPGNYELQAWVRNNGVTADTWQAWGRLPYTVTGSGLTVTLSSVTLDQASPQAAGTPRTITATVTGGVGPYQFKWWVWDGTTWTVARDWAAGNTFTWTPPTPGSYEIQAWVRTSGVTADTWQAWGRLTYTVMSSGLTMTSVTANRTGIRPVGRSLTLTATATGGVAPLQFKWWVWNGSNWTVARDWAAGNTLTWTPRVPGDYQIQVWVRSTGTSGEPPEAYGNLPVTVR